MVPPQCPLCTHKGVELRDDPTPFFPSFIFLHNTEIFGKFIMQCQFHIWMRRKLHGNPDLALANQVMILFDHHLCYQDHQSEPTSREAATDARDPHRVWGAW